MKMRSRFGKEAKANAKNDKDDALYMRMAAQVAMRNLKDKAQAIKLLESIKSEERRNVELMNYLTADEIVTKFKDVDFSKYPEDIQLSANYRLANAFYKKKKCLRKPWLNMIKPLPVPEEIIPNGEAPPSKLGTYV